MGAVILLLIIGFSGCTEFRRDNGNEEGGVPTAEIIVSRLLETIDEISSYKYSADVAVTKTMINATTTNTTEITAMQNGEVDIINKKLCQNNTGMEGYKSQHWIVYIINNFQYSGTETNGIISWTNYNTSHTNATMTWNAYDVLEGIKLFFKQDYLDSLDNYTIEQLQDDSLSNVKCYVLQVTTSYENKTGDDGGSFSMPGNISQHTETTLWIAKETYRLMKTYSSSTSESTGWYAFGYPDVEQSLISQKMEVLFYDYDIPIIIELPPEAEHNQFP